MIKVIAIDDEPLALRQLEMYISKVPYLEMVASCRSASQAVPFLTMADAMFLDIDMPDLSGMDFVKGLSSPPMVVFTTAYSQYAVEGFRVNAVDYLLKPFSFKEFCASCEKLQERMAFKDSLDSVLLKDTVLQFKADYKTITVPVRDIVYVESMSEYMKIYLQDADTPVIILYSLRRLMGQLPSGHFMRIHRSYIISLDHITEASRTSVKLKGGRVLPIGEVYRPAFASYLSTL